MSPLRELLLSNDSSSVSFLVTPPPPSPPSLTKAIFGDDGADRVLDVVAGDGSFRRRMVILCGGISRHSVGIKYSDYVNRERDEDQCDDEDYCDLDDELIPWSVSKKLKRDRMRKLGKKSLLKPGCVYGKHGLGIRFFDF